MWIRIRLFESRKILDETRIQANVTCHKASWSGASIMDHVRRNDDHVAFRGRVLRSVQPESRRAHFHQFEDVVIMTVSRKDMPTKCRAYSMYVVRGGAARNFEDISIRRHEAKNSPTGQIVWSEGFGFAETILWHHSDSEGGESA